MHGRYFPCCFQRSQPNGKPRSHDVDGFSISWCSEYMKLYCCDSLENNLDFLHYFFPQHLGVTIFARNNTLDSTCFDQDDREICPHHLFLLAWSSHVRFWKDVTWYKGCNKEQLCMVHLSNLGWWIARTKDICLSEPWFFGIGIGLGSTDQWFFSTSCWWSSSHLASSVGEGLRNSRGAPKKIFVSYMPFEQGVP